MSKNKSNNNMSGNKPDGLNLLSGLITRLDIQEAEIRVIKEALGIHESRLNSINIPPESVNAIGIRTLRMLGQMLLTVTEPAQASVQEKPPAPGMQEVTQDSEGVKEAPQEVTG